MRKFIVVLMCGVLGASLVPATSSGPVGSNTSCDLDARTFGYADDQDCTSLTYFEFDLTHSEVSCESFCYANVIGFEPGNFAFRGIRCPDGGSIVVDWSDNSAILQNGECEINFGGDISTVDWYAYGYGDDGVSFSHGDNLADTLLAHLL